MAARMMSGIATTGGPAQLLVSNLDFGSPHTNFFKIVFLGRGMAARMMSGIATTDGPVKLPWTLAARILTF
jgi:hypothetical protein